MLWGNFKEKYESETKIKTKKTKEKEREREEESEKTYLVTAAKMAWRGLAGATNQSLPNVNVTFASNIRRKA